MSDSIPIVAFVMPPNQLVDALGNERAEKVRQYRIKEQKTSEIGEPKQNLLLFAASRGGMIIYLYQKILTQISEEKINFLANQSFTFEHVDGCMLYHYTVITEGFDEVISAIDRVLIWIKNNPSFVAEITGDDSEGVIEAVDNPKFSLDPNGLNRNYDDFVCDGDFWSAALAVSVLVTVREMLRIAQKESSYFVCEQFHDFVEG